LAKSVLDESVPFGIILIAVGKGGLPDNVRVIPVSRLARESNIKESELKAKLQDGSCLSMTAGTFVRLLSNVQAKVLDGAMSLPVPIEQLTREMREGA